MLIAREDLDTAAKALMQCSASLMDERGIKIVHHMTEKAARNAVLAAIIATSPYPDTRVLVEGTETVFFGPRHGS